MGIDDMDAQELTSAVNLFAVAQELYNNWGGFADVECDDERYFEERLRKELTEYLDPDRDAEIAQAVKAGVTRCADCISQ